MWRRRGRKRSRRRRRLWQEGAAAFLRTVACWPGRGGCEAHLGPPFISDTCHLAPNLHQKWTKMHQKCTNTGFFNLEHLKSVATELAEKREGHFRFLYDNCLV